LKLNIKSRTFHLTRIQKKMEVSMPRIDLAMYDKKNGLLSLFEQHNEELQRWVDAGEIARSTLTKYKTIRKKVAAYINMVHKRDDLPVKVIPPRFLKEFHCNLVFEQKITHNTAVTYIEMLQKIFRLAIDNDLIYKKDMPDYSYTKRKISSTDYLTIRELIRIEELRGNNDINRDFLLMFLFSCYTGVTETEINHINTEDIVEEESEEDLWLAAEGVERWEIRYVPLSIEAEDIIGMFERKRLWKDTELLFPVELDDNIEEELNIIARKADIQRPITFLTAVNTFYFSYSQYMNYPQSSYKRLIPHHQPTNNPFLQYTQNEC
jgi:hypothetical protein